MPGVGYPRTLALTDLGWRALATISRPERGICPHCRRDVYVWAGRVACVDRTAKPSARYCPGNGKPPALVSTSERGT